MLRHRVFYVLQGSTARLMRRLVTTVTLARRTPTATRQHRVRLAWRDSTLLVLLYRAQIAPPVVRTSTRIPLPYAKCAATVSTLRLARLCVLSVCRTRWMMTLIRLHHARRV